MAEKRQRGAGEEAAVDEGELCRDGLPFAVAALVAMVAMTFAPGVPERGAVQLHTWIAAGVVSAALLLLRASGRPLPTRMGAKRPHYMQAITQTGVFVWWGTHWAPVKSYVWLLLIQLAFAYLCEMAFAWARRRTWRAGFGPIPITFSINLFLWFKDPHFGWQLLLIALCYVGKEMIRWERDGQRRHIFNPSSFGLAVMSAALLITGTTGATYAREIAVTQEETRFMWEALFVLGLIVQIQFPVVLVTMSSAVTVWLLGLGWQAATGTYLFATADIPAAVFLGMLLLVTDPATSPRGRTGKVLYGAAYGAMVVAIFPLLDDWGGYGYFDKLLPVPILNLLVRRFDAVGDRWGEALEARWDAFRGGAVAWITNPRTANYAHVGTWGAFFGVLFVSNAFGAQHPGRDITLWQKACAEDRPRACRTFFELLSNGCEGGEPKACHNLGAELVERHTTAGGHGPEFFFAMACDGGLEVSCEAAAQLRGEAPSGEAPSGQTVRTGAPGGGLGDHPLAAMCAGGDAEACHNLGAAYQNGVGVARDIDKAMAAYDVGCKAGLVQSCNSVAALAMQRGGDVDKTRAAQAFGKACEAGDMPGCANLAAMHFRGDGIERNLGEAARLHRKACEGGLGIACARLADAYAEGQGVEADPERARTLRAKACSLGFQAACDG